MPLSIHSCTSRPTSMQSSGFAGDSYYELSVCAAGLDEVVHAGDPFGHYRASVCGLVGAEVVGGVV